ncbi:MAG: conjugal transfer protein TraR [Gammaproteobacteria bacterium HGW-Gammaproteobacteria-6]|jgi:DnaK suppressor protein|nr:MAG: conjugal transfer protein TraR [Gammaproteobacteria bacterium HGW-Gammaproteobacteria-6]
MTPEQLQAFRQQLLALKQELGATEATANEAAKPVELDQTSVGRLSRMDAMQGQAMAMAVQQRRAHSLRKIDAALARIESGDYGFCSHCDEAINPRRLEVDPTTTLCIACAEKSEA